MVESIGKGVFMKGQILAVDFENKKLRKETQPKSENKTNKHYLNHTQVCDGAVTLFTTKASSGIWLNDSERKRSFFVDKN